MAGLIQAPRSGTVLKVTGVAIVAATFLLIPAIDFIFEIDFDDNSVRMFNFFLIPLGAMVYWRGRQYEARARAQDIIATSKAHVLYLRPFETDQSATYLSTMGSGGWALRGIWKTEEEHLADALRPFGALIAIGQPKVLPSPGAARIYTSDEEWKDVVKRQMQTAQLVVIRAGSGENVFWELTQARNIVNPQRLLILVKMFEDTYRLFRTRANSVLRVPLPERRKRLRISGFIGFAEDWKPSFFPLGGLQYFLAGRFKYALKPVFESFGLEWRAPWVSVARVTAALFGLAVGAIVIVGWLRPDFNTDVFRDSQHRDEVVKVWADACKSTTTDPVRKWQCDCIALASSKVINVQEVDAVSKGQIPDSLLKKLKRFKCHRT